MMFLLTLYLVIGLVLSAVILSIIDPLSYRDIVPYICFITICWPLILVDIVTA